MDSSISTVDRAVDCSSTGKHLQLKIVGKQTEKHFSLFSPTDKP